MLFKYFNWRCFALFLKEVTTLKALLSPMTTAWIIYFLLPSHEQWLHARCYYRNSTDIHDNSRRTTRDCASTIITQKSTCILRPNL